MKKLMFFLIGISFLNITLQAQKQVPAEINFDKFETGQIISVDEKGKYFISQNPYDPLIIGVFQKGKKTLIDTQNKIYVVDEPKIISQGIALVRYNSENGQIKKGDPLTTSSTAGVAMKATKSGVILGIALEDAQSNEGMIKIRLLIQYVR